MKLRSLIIIVTIAVMALAGACKSGQTMVNNGNHTDINSGVNNANLLTASAIASKQGAWTTLKSGGSIELGGTTSLSSGMQMRMRRGEFIWISLRPMLGIEAARLVITDNRVIIIDKMHKRYLDEDVSLLTAGVPVTVETLQDIFLGRVHVLGSGSLSPGNARLLTASAGGELRPVDNYKGFTYAYRFDSQGHVTSLEVKPERVSSKVQGSYTVNYADVVLTLAGNVAREAGIATTIKGKPLSLTLYYDDMKWNGDVEADLTVPDGYSKMDASKLFSIF